MPAAQLTSPAREGAQEAPNDPGRAAGEVRQRGDVSHVADVTSVELGNSEAARLRVAERGDQVDVAVEHEHGHVRVGRAGRHGGSGTAAWATRGSR